MSLTYHLTIILAWGGWSVYHLAPYIQVWGEVCTVPSTVGDKVTDFRVVAFPFILTLNIKTRGPFCEHPELWKPKKVEEGGNDTPGVEPSPGKGGGSRELRQDPPSSPPPLGQVGGSEQQLAIAMDLEDAA